MKPYYFYKETSVIQDLSDDKQYTPKSHEEIQTENELLRSRKTTPLHIACEDGDLDILINLLEIHDLDVDAIDENGNTPLHVLFSKDREYKLIHYITSLFVLKEANLNIIDKYGRTLLHLACKYNLPHLIQYIIHKGSDPNIPDKFGKTPIYYAIEFNLIYVVTILIDRGAKAQLIGVPLQPLHIACSVVTENWKDNLDIGYILINHGADVNAIHRVFLYTPLHACMYHSKMYMMKLLLEFKADINAKQVGGNTPLHLANNLEIVKELVKRGANITIKNDLGITPKSKLYKNKEITEYLKGL